MEMYMFLKLWADESGMFLLMFVLSGIFLSLFMEVVKKQIFPKPTDDEIAKGKVEKKCPAWVGMLLGVLNTIIFTACAIMADIGMGAHSAIPGGLWFVAIWFIGFYLWQWLAGKAVKLFLKRIVPCFMTGKPRKPHVSRPTVEVPRGVKVKYVDMKEDEIDE